MFIGCGGASHYEMGTQINKQELTSVLASPKSVDYAAVKRFVLDKNCIGCHSGAAKKNGIDLSSYGSITEGHDGRKLVELFSPGDSLLMNVLKTEGKRHMPPAGEVQLSEAQIQLVYTWIANGARRSEDEPIDPRGKQLQDQLAPYFEHPENIDYPAVRKFVLASTCVKCHSVQGDSKDIDAIQNSANLTSYQTTLDLSGVVKGKPAESKLFEATAIKQIMPPPKAGYPPLDSLRTKLLRLWILNCAIEDKAALGNEVLHPDIDNPSEKVRDCEPSPPPQSQSLAE